jgi:phosphoserine phosphatase
MNLVLTLITSPDRANITNHHIDQARTILDKAGCDPKAPLWLAENISCDIEFDDTEPTRSLNFLREGMQRSEIDIVVQPRADRRKRLLLADMDSTIVVGETLDQLADYAGVKDQIAAITERAMRGEIEFKRALRERVSMLKGLSADTMEECLNNTKLTQGASALVKTMRANGAYTVLVSGGFSFFTQAIAKIVGFNEERSNTIIIEHGALTGEIGEPILDHEAKLESLKTISKEKGISLIDTMAIGDGANDLPMILNAGVGVAFHAKPVVEEQAPAAIRYGDLTALLYLQGYRQKEFID